MPAGSEILAFNAMDGLKVAGLVATPVIAGATAVGLHKSVPDGHFALVERFGRARDTRKDAASEDTPRIVLSPGSYWDIPIFRRLKVISTLDRGVSGQSEGDSNNDEAALSRIIDFPSDDTPASRRVQCGFSLTYAWGIKPDEKSLYRSRYRNQSERGLTDFVKGAVSTSVQVAMYAMGFSAVCNAVEQQGSEGDALFELTKSHADAQLDKYGAELRNLWVADFARTSGQMLVDAVREHETALGSALILPIEQQL
jgi:hypothetical protein